MRITIALCELILVPYHKTQSKKGFYLAYGIAMS